MDQAFIQKRIKEQEDYIRKIISDSSINPSRAFDLVVSAAGQLIYFQSKVK